jgi:DNA topoisomerase-3
MRNISKFVTDPRYKQKLKETAGIGTVATQAGHVEGLIDRRYLLKDGRALHASPAGLTLIDAVPKAVADPVTSAIWEQALDLIAAGRMTVDEFVAKQSAWVSQIVREHAHTSLSLPLPESPACPSCGARTRQRVSPHGPFWSCTRYPDCKGTLAIAHSTRPRAPAARKAARPRRTRRPRST